MTNKENEPEDLISLEAVRDFLQRNNGKVKQTDLVNHFRVQLSSHNQDVKVKARQEFKDILQLITAVKTEDGEKFIVLIKQAQEHFQTSVISRKAQRPLSVRKELTKSRLDFLHQAQSIAEQSDNDERSSQASDFTDQSNTSSSVATLRGRIQGTVSVDSISSMLTNEEVADLEEDIGLNDGVDVSPEEKEWMMAAARGNLKRLEKLYKSQPALVKKKDFIMGYTALHWGAKLGRPDIVKFIASAGADIHTKSHGGYTPLHLAAICGRDQVITQLIELHGANIHIRDHSGKKAKDVVKDTVTADSQRKLGRSLVLGPDVVLRHNSLRVPLHRNGANFEEGYESPVGTPEIARRHLNTIGAIESRVRKSFLKKKKKHHESPRPRVDHIDSPHLSRRNSSQNTGPPKERPKSETLLPPSCKQAPPHELISTISFEI